MEKTTKQFDLCTMNHEVIFSELTIEDGENIVMAGATPQVVYSEMYKNGLEYAHICRRVICIFGGRYESECCEHALTVYLPKGRDVKCDLTTAQVRGGYFDCLACDYAGEEVIRLKAMQESPYFREFRNGDPGYQQRAKYVLGYEDDELPEVIYEFMKDGRPDLFTPSGCPRWYRKMRKEMM